MIPTMLIGSYNRALKKAPLPDEIDNMHPIRKIKDQQTPEIEDTKPQMNKPTSGKRHHITQTKRVKQLLKWKIQKKRN